MLLALSWYCAKYIQHRDLYPSAFWRSEVGQGILAPIYRYIKAAHGIKRTEPALGKTEGKSSPKTTNRR